MLHKEVELSSWICPAAFQGSVFLFGNGEELETFNSVEMSDEGVLIQQSKTK